MCLKKYFMFFVVLVLVSVQVFAWPLKSTEKEVTPNEETIQNVSSEKSTETLTVLETQSTNSLTASDLEGRTVVMGKDLATLKEQFYTLEDSVALLIEDNRKLNEELDKEKGQKFFADLGLAFGVSEGSIMYGAVGDIGMRFGKGLMLKLGGQYMLGSFSDITKFNWSIDNLTVNATIGWEW